MACPGHMSSVDRHLMAWWLYICQVFAYGQTGSGKTFTMGTAASTAQMAGWQGYCGVIPRVVSYIFARLPVLQANYSVSLVVRPPLPCSVPPGSGPAGTVLVAGGKAKPGCRKLLKAQYKHGPSE